MRKKLIASGAAALMSGVLLYVCTHLSSQDPFRISPILHGATMTQPEMQADPLRANSMTGDATRDLYKLMSDVAALFEKNGIDYWITCGTLLGAVRHQGVIPYDDDLDVSVWQKDLEKIKALKPQLLQLGYDMYQDRTSLKIYKKDGVTVRPKRGSFQLFTGVWFVRHKKERFPFMDIYGMEKQGPIIQYSLAKARKVFPKEYYQEGEIYPLKRYKFGNLTVWGPHEAQGFFQRNYGQNWSKNLVFEGHHSSSTKQKFYIPLTPSLTRKLQNYQGF